MGNKIPGTVENWENGKLGLNPDQAKAASPEEVAAIEQAAGVSMQLISMRMPTDLLRVLKEIAKYRGIGYQPMIRDLLDRWAVGEIKTILNERLEETEKRETEQQASTPLAGDLRRTA
jgi:hypothetical protein